MPTIADIQARLAQVEELLAEYERIIARKDAMIDRLTTLATETKDLLVQVTNERDTLLAALEAARGPQGPGAA